MTSMNSPAASYVLRDIAEPHEHDVLCGRGGGTNNHIGNSHWRLLVAANKQLYMTLPKRQKMLLSRSIVNAVRSQNPPGRFLEKNSKTNMWYDVGDQRAQEKTSQALREGAPDMKKKGKSEEEGTGIEQSETKYTEITDNATNSTATTGTSATTPPESPNAASSRTKIPTSLFPTSYGSMPNSSSASSPPPAVSAAVSGGSGSGGYIPEMQTAPVLSLPHQFFSAAQMVQMQMAQMNNQHHQQQPQPEQGVFIYAGPNMQPVRLYPTMVMNEHGVMVPGMSMMPGTGFMPSVHPAGVGSGGAHSLSNHLPQPGFIPHNVSDDLTSQQHELLQQQQHQQTLAQAFDEYLGSAPPEGFLGGLSFGSTYMTDAELMKLQANGTFGSMMSNPTKDENQAGEVGTNSATNPQAPASLEPTGISFGDVSMMSVGTINKLHADGTSFGTMMSTGTNMPEGGLEAIGASFGSLSLDPQNRGHLFQVLEVTGGGPEIPPMFATEAKATSNLLECSDTESEDSFEAKRAETGSSQKSEAWERMRASVAQTRLRHSQSKESGSLNSSDLMPPPLNVRSTYPVIDGSILSVPNTTLHRDFSQLSAMDDDSDHGRYGL